MSLDRSTFKLGKTLPQIDSRTLMLDRYIDAGKLEPPPIEDDNYNKLSRQTWALNNEYGCCVVAGAVHTVQVCSSLSAREQIISDDAVKKTYLGLTGGKDTGLNEMSFLKWWLKNPIAGHPLGAFIGINPRNITAVKTAIHLFGAVMLGVGLPTSAEKQPVWDLVEGGPDSVPYSWGGHCTIAGKYDKQGNLYHYTWAEVIKSTPKFAAYYDEAYALLMLDWFRADHKSPDGFAWSDLKSDLGKIKRAGT